MKPFALVLGLLSLSPLASAQSHEHGTAAATAAPTETQKAFAALKTVAGSWVGPLTTNPPVPDVAGKFAQVSMRVTSMGHAFEHEMWIAGRPDHPITMFYQEADRLLLTHYCDAGNRPRMSGKASPDGKTVEFDFVDLSGGNEKGHMHHVVFTFVDADHHTEDWTYMMPGDRPMRAHLELQRTHSGGGAAGH
jgi:hypothetical protein